MKNTILSSFQQRFAKTPLLVRAPGRFNLIGEHTDYNMGWVMPAAIAQNMWFAMALSDDPASFEFEAMDMGESCRFSWDSPEAKGVSWSHYTQAVLLEMREKGFPVKGVQCVFGGNIPMGAGLSSSAALCCGLAFGISALQNLKIDKRDIALIAQAAEHRIGLNCGLMDQYAVLFGKAGHLLCLDCRSLDFRLLPLGIEGCSLMLINSKVKHSLAAGSGYNDRRRSCEKVVATLRPMYPAFNSLRDVPMEILEKNLSLYNPVDYRRAKFVLEENQRVLHMIEALHQNDIAAIGKLLYQSHEGLKTGYEVTVPEIDLLIDLAKKESAVLGARMVGGGFGGCTLNLIKTSDAPAVLNRIASAYFQETGVQADIIEVSAGDGATIVEN